MQLIWRPLGIISSFSRTDYPISGALAPSGSQGKRADGHRKDVTGMRSRFDGRGAEASGRGYSKLWTWRIDGSASSRVLAKGSTGPRRHFNRGTKGAFPEGRLQSLVGLWRSSNFQI
jgi:hypothetical protein